MKFGFVRLVCELDRLLLPVHGLQEVARFREGCRERGVTAFLATAHDDLIDVLAPDAVIRLDLDGTSGTGRISIPLARGGLHVFCLDSSADMQRARADKAQAENLAERITTVVAHLRNVRLPEPVAAAILGNNNIDRLHFGLGELASRANAGIAHPSLQEKATFDL